MVIILSKDTIDQGTLVNISKLIIYNYARVESNEDFVKIDFPHYRQNGSDVGDERIPKEVLTTVSNAESVSGLIPFWLEVDDPFETTAPHYMHPDGSRMLFCFNELDSPETIDLLTNYLLPDYSNVFTEEEVNQILIEYVV